MDDSTDTFATDTTHTSYGSPVVDLDARRSAARVVALPVDRATRTASARERRSRVLANPRRSRLNAWPTVEESSAAREQG